VKSWLGSLKVYLDRRVISILFLGFSSGLPLALVFSTLSTWLKDVGVSKTAIGFVTLVGTAYSLKFLWSPLVDRVPLPLLTRLLGRRRSWMLVSQLALMASIFLMGSTDPSTMEGLWWTVLLAVVVAFASATQDIAIDAYRVEILEEEKYGAGAANIVFGYRIAMLVSGAGTLILADQAGWFWAYTIMAAFMVVGIVATLINPEPTASAAPAGAAAGEAPDGEDPFQRRLREVLHWFRTAVAGPFADFIKRPGWLVILLFVAFYKYGDALLGVMANPFYLEIGFTKTEIGAVSKGFGFLMTLLGAGLGGILVARIGILRALLWGGVLQAASNLVFAWQAHVGDSIPWLIFTISVENLTGGIGTTAFVAYLSSLCNVAYTATQYALLSSLMSFARNFFAAGGGWLADQVNWVTYFLLTTAAAIPGLLLLLWLMRLYPARAGEQATAEESDPGAPPDG